MVTDCDASTEVIDMKKPTKKESTKTSTTNLLQPRLCHLIKWTDYSGFGFNLMTKKEESGHFISDVEQLGPADLSGLRDGDRVIEVNGTNVEREAHLSVAQMISASGDEVKLLVVDEQTHSYYQQRGYTPESSNINVVYIRTPDKQPNGSFEPTVVYERNFAEDSYVMNTSRQGSTTTKKTIARYTSVPQPSTIEYQQTNRESVEMKTITNSARAEPPSFGSYESGFISLTEPYNGKINPPRMCQIRKWTKEEGYGFSLNTPKDRRGHFISKIDENSPASNCGIKHYDRIIEVNGSNIELTPHSDVTDMIKRSSNDEVTLLVVDEESYNWYCEHGIEVTGSLPSIIRMRNPEPIPEKIHTAGGYLNSRKENTPENNSRVPVEEPLIEKPAKVQQNTATPANGHIVIHTVESSNVAINTAGQEFILPDDAPAPRLCHIVLVPHYSGFGFGLRTYKATGFKYIVDIKPRSPAFYCGLREWDRVIEVNGINVNVDNHSQVCARIQYNPNEIKLLVMDEKEYVWYTKRNLVPKSTQSNIIYLSNLVENVEANNSPIASNANVYELTAEEVRERISTLKRQDPRNKNVDFQKRIELYEKL